MSKEQREHILNLYTTPGEPIAFSGRTKLKRSLGLSNDVNREVLSYNYAYGLHRDSKRPRNFNPYFTKHPREQIHCDLIDMQQYSKENDNVKYLLVCIDIFSRKIWVKPLKTKEGKPTTAAMESILQELEPITPGSIQVDYGKEFRNKYFLQLLKDYKVKLFNPYSDNKAVFAERVNGTIQKLIHNYMKEKGTLTYIDVLPLLIKTYNSRQHRAFNHKYSPLEAERHDNLNSIKQLLQQKQQKIIMKGRKMKPKFKINDLVRLRKMKTKFERGYGQKFTDEIFRIIKINHKLPIITYSVQSTHDEENIEGTFYAEDLQLIQGDMYRVEKIVKTKMKKGKKYAFVKWLNYSDEHNSWIPYSNLINV